MLKPTTLLRACVLALLVLSNPARAEVVDIGPLDDTLTHPWPADVARNFGVWTDTESTPAGPNRTLYDVLDFAKNGFKGHKYLECGVWPFNYPHLHAQHVVRLPNKNGQAYLMVSQSDYFVDDNGSGTGPVYPAGRISLYRSDSQVDSSDRVPNVSGVDGRIIWEQEFKAGAFPAGQGGAWNHPCKMDVLGNVLVVAMQNWDGNVCVDGQGTQADAVVFYDVRDPASPRYWGKITRDELSASAGTSLGNIDDLTLLHTGGEWVLTVHGHWWRTGSVYPAIGSWSYGGTGSPSAACCGPQHGQNFYSLELANPVQPQNLSSEPGRRRIMFFDAKGEDPDNGVAGNEYFWFTNIFFGSPISFGSLYPRSQILPSAQVFRSAPNVVGGNHDYDSTGIYVSGGVPIIYAPLEGDPYNGPHDKIYQIYTPANVWLDHAKALESSLIWKTDGSGTDGMTVWFGQFDISHDGTDAVQTGNVRNNETTHLETTVTGPGNLSFWWKVSSQQNSDFLRFELDGVQQGSAPQISGEVDWQQRTVVIPAGVHTVRWLYTTDASGSSGTNAAWLDQVTYIQGVNEAVDNYRLPLSFENTGNWFWQNTTTHDGEDAARSASIFPLQATTLRTTVYGPGSLSFWWRVSSEQNFDFLRFTLDGAVQGAQISGETAWAQRTISIPAGFHTLRWTYEKDFVTTAGLDAGVIDQVVWNATTVSNADETGPGSLSDTIAGLSPGSTITFDATLDGQTITLEDSLITIDKNLTIDASSLPNGVTITATGKLMEILGGATVSLVGLTLSDSDAPSWQPEAIMNYGELTCTDCTVSGNTQAFHNFGTLTLINTTVSGNSGADSGAGLVNWGTATLRHTTLCNNDSIGYGGGIYNGGTLTLENSIVAMNSSVITSSPVDIYNDGGTIVPLGANLIGDNSSVEAWFPAGPLHGEPGTPVDPRLGALADNGGSTQTMALARDSLAVDAAIPTGSSPATDQRGVTRPKGPEDDLGAYELSKIAVTNANDAGAGSLRQAIADAEAGDLIEFQPSIGGPINLTSGGFVIDKDLSFDAWRLPDGVSISINGGRVFEIRESVNVSMKRLSISGGVGDYGPGIFNAGTLTLLESTLSGNSGSYGGALMNWIGATAVISDSTLTGNSATAAGGAIFNNLDATMTLTNSTLSGNSAGPWNGGALLNDRGSVTVTHATVVNNSAGSFGGGIDNAGGTLTLTNSIVAGNTGPAPGGGPDIGNRDGGTVVCGGSWCEYDVRQGTGEIGEGVQLAISQNGEWFTWGGGGPGDLFQSDGNGFTVGGRIHSPSGAPDLWFRAASSPTFPGALDDFAHWFLGGSYIGGSHDPGTPWEGAAHGTDNWMKVIRDGDGCVSWAQFEFDFSQPPGSTAPVLVEIPLYVRRNDCADFSIAEAVGASAALNTSSNLIGNNDTVSVEFPAGPLHGTVADPRAHGLGPLAANGGPTQTRLPLPGSLAIDAISIAAGTDQRGFPRPVGAAGDIGAVEYACSVSTDGDCDGAINVSDNCPTVPNGYAETALANVGNQTDFDLDGVGDACDNCRLLANPRVASSFLTTNPWATLTGGQRDDDHDGFGNRCDADFTATGALIGTPDLTQWRAANGKSRANLSACGSPAGQRCARYDMDESGTLIGSGDLTIFRSLNGKAAGPKCTTCPLPCEPGSAGTCF